MRRFVRSASAVLSDRDGPVHATSTTSTNDGRTLSVADDRVRALRDHLLGAKTGVENSLRYTMWPEVREGLRGAQSDLVKAISHIGA